MMRTLSTVLALAFVAIASADVDPTSVKKIVTFDNAKSTTQKWKNLNDPVMGGQSNSTYKIDTTAKQVTWEGDVKIVPSLKAPGFCNLETSKMFGKFDDASGNTHLLIRARTSTPAYQGFKLSFAADTLIPQFYSYKSNFYLKGNDWQTVAIPLNNFSNDWSSFTGDCFTKDPNGKQHYCCDADHPKVCPSQKSLRDISQVGLWTEGQAGHFNIEVQWIGSGNLTKSRPVADVVAAAPVSAIPKGDNTCSGPVQPKLMFNVTHRLAADYLPFPAPADETLAEAICCDKNFRAYAEPQQFFARPDVDLFAKIEKAGLPFTFYDPVCGIPLLTAPLNRTLAEWKAESTEHGWPSFRMNEIVSDNVVVSKNGDVSSKCGTHLGGNLPDAKGPRLCLDLVCVSGVNAKLL